MSKTIYAPKINSPQTTIVNGIDSDDTSIVLVNSSVLPAAPCLCTLGLGNAAETILYTSLSGNTISGITRAVEGTAIAWPSGTKVARYFSSYDYLAFKEHIETLEVQNGSETLNTTATTLSGAINENTDSLANTMNNYIFYISDQESVASKFTIGTTLANGIINYASVIAYFDKFVTSYSNFVVKTDLGLDETGVYSIYKYVFTPTAYTKTFVINCGIHGGEYVTPFSVYNLMDALYGEKFKHQFLDELRENVRFVIIPISNPHGWDHNTRYNGNGVDINRNFDYLWSSVTDYPKGDSAFSEAEAVIIRDILLDYKPDAYFDLHNTGAFDYNYYAEVDTTDPTANTVKSIMSFLYERALVDYPSLTAGGTLNPTGTAGSSYMYTSRILGVPSTSLEWVPNKFDTIYSTLEMTKCLELYANEFYFVYRKLDRGIPNIYQIAISAAGADYVENSNFTRITSHEKTITIKEDCTAIFSGSVTLKNEAASGVNIVQAYVLVSTSDTSGSENASTANEVYSDYGGRFTLPLYASNKFVKGNTLKCNLFLQSPTGKTLIYRYRGIIQIIPNSKRATI